MKIYKNKRNSISIIMKTVAQTIALLAVIPLLVSCEVDASDNGDLDGFWHLESVDTLATGGTLDMSRLHAFWGVEYKLIAARETDGHSGDRFYFRFEQTTDSLKLTKVYVDHGHQDNGDDGGDIPLYNPTANLRYFGVNEIPEGFRKEKLTGSLMILRSKTLRLTFKKF